MENVWGNLMKTCPYYLVNVFAETHFAGNPLAVFLINQPLPNDTMQIIAQQMNLSETVFLDLQSNIPNIRIFTPDSELAFAGHPVLGSAFIYQYLTKKLDNDVQLQTQVGTIHLEKIQQNQYVFTRPIGGCELANFNQEDLANAIGLPIENVTNPAYWVNTGFPQLLIKLNNLEDLQQLKLNNQLIELCKKANKRCVVYFWVQQKHHISARLLFEEFGSFREDVGTGSACCNLGCWFWHHKNKQFSTIIKQGDHLNRPNRLLLQVNANNIQVGGNVILVGKGEIYLP